MNYPIWEVPIVGGGILIGAIAILHVFVSHFAVGGGLFLVLAERKAYRENDPGLLSFVRSHTRVFVLVVLVFGAVSGVGIWWTIGLVHPPATSTLIHVFVWVWALEWVAFLVEITAAFVYYFGWDRLDRTTHLRVGWIYFIAAWVSLFQINGILTFMLTPGDWPASRSLADAFFNPTMLPSLIIRTAVSLALAGLYALMTATTLADGDLRARVVRYASKWLFPSVVLIPAAGVWYIASIPPLAREISMGGAPAVTIFAGLSIVFSILLFATAYLGPYLYPRSFNVGLAFVLAVLGLMTTAVTEWVREAVRKPYVIYGYMYSNGIRLEETGRLREEGALAAARWSAVAELSQENRLAAGAEIFKAQCSSCHTLAGYNGIRILVKGWRREFIEEQIEHLNELKGFMPPFMGTAEERRALADWLANLNR